MKRLKGSREAANVDYYRLRIEGGWRSLLLPGLGQLHKGHVQRGIVLMSAAGVSTVGLVASQFAVQEAGDRYRGSDDPDLAADLYDKYLRTWRLRNGFGIALAAVWIGSALDAFLSPPPLNETPEVGVRIGLLPIVGEEGGTRIQLLLRW
ncbi:MAG TPA: hypothetical protein ENI92_10235 [Bacteroidetes bacterium]|nr:hypothetical protein [Bacteroidota bacterium]